MDGYSDILWFVLDEESRTRLKQAVPPLYPNEYYDHVTLLYGVPRSEVEEFIGQQRQVKVYAVAHNVDAQACRVETDGLPDTYGVPHITLSTRKGIKPFASVAMLKGKHEESVLEPPITLSGTIEFKLLRDVKD